MKFPHLNPIPLRALTTVCFSLTLTLNYLSTTGALGGRPQADVSSSLPTLLTPSPTAFTIWPIIYTLQFVFIVYCWSKRGREDVRIDRGLGLAPAFNFAANGAWTVAFSRGAYLLSCLIMLSLFLSLCLISFRGRLNYWPVRRIQRWPGRSSLLPPQSERERERERGRGRGRERERERE